MSTVIIKSKEQIAKMRAAGRLAARTIEEVAKILKVGLSTDEINAFVHDYTIKHGGKPAPLGYRGYPKSVCTSINEVVCHGIPSSRRLLDGDIINVDVTTVLDGWHGDVSATFYIGKVSDEARHLVEVTRKCLDLAIEQVRPGARLGNIGAVIQEHAEKNGCSVVRDFVGHGLGRGFHEAPQVPHLGEWDRGLRLKTGMTFTIEPMINQGGWELYILDDDWTAVTKDHKLSAQFEHTLAVTVDGCEILTAFSGPLASSNSNI
ncbi:MAG: type I methionyl aminopeptidase [Myxococcota bacterium]|jgi:methionyl aminopeptidase|nr:type I methionyl aminopeptidase [Myxococcota bacterium]